LLTGVPVKDEEYLQIVDILMEDLVENLFLQVSKQTLNGGEHYE